MLMRIERKNRTKGGLFIPEQHKDDQPGKTRIVKKGEDCTRADIGVGDEVIIDPRSVMLDFSHLNLAELKDFFLIRESDVAARVERTEA
jgi:co-chaperonin GroES (HSP10)